MNKKKKKIIVEDTFCPYMYNMIAVIRSKMKNINTSMAITDYKVK